jgi:hypothetical protein
MDRTVCHNEVFTSELKCLKAVEPLLLMQTGKDAHPHPQTVERAQAMIHGNCRVTIAETAARLGINVARPWFKPLVQQPSLRHTTQHKWTTNEPHSQHATV